MAEEEGGLWGVSGTFTAPGGGGRGEAEIRASEPPGARRAQGEWKRAQGKEWKPLLEGADSAHGKEPTPRVHAASSTDFFSFVRSFHFGDAGSPLEHSPSCCSGAYLPRGMRPLSSPPREGTPVPCIGRRILPVDSRCTPLAGEELTHVKPCPQCSGHSSTGLGDTWLSPSTCLLGEVDAH